MSASDLQQRLGYNACIVAGRYPKAADAMHEAAAEISLMRAILRNIAMNTKDETEFKLRVIHDLTERFYDEA